MDSDSALKISAPSKFHQPFVAAGSAEAALSKAEAIEIGSLNCNK
jgi:hypothetical protein